VKVGVKRRAFVVFEDENDIRQRRRAFQHWDQDSGSYEDNRFGMTVFWF
jgi:hypothetical protein